MFHCSFNPRLTDYAIKSIAVSNRLVVFSHFCRKAMFISLICKCFCCRNYVVQYVIELRSSLASSYMLAKFKGHYVQLSVQKFSSHVVEKCLKHFEESRSQIIREILSVSHFEQLMQDPYANYVIQSALAVTKVLKTDTCNLNGIMHTLMLLSHNCS